MTYRLTGKWRLVVSLASAFIVVSACAGDPPKRSVRVDGEGGDGGGGPGVGDGGSRPPAGDAGANNESTAGAGGAPVGTKPEQGGMPAVAGMPNEPTAGAPNLLPQCEATLVFPDPWVDQLVHAAVDTNGPLTSADVANVTALSIPFTDGDVDLTGLECLSGLTKLDLDRGGQTSMEVLADLPNLRTVTFTAPYGVDLAALAALTQITSLDLRGLAEGDFSELANLTNLEDLNLSGVGPFGQVPVDITPVGTLTKLKSLDLSGVAIADAAPLASLTALERLSLRNAKFANITPVLGLTKLRSVSLANTKITIIPNLTALTQLTTLDVSYNTFTDFTPLASHSILTDLNVAGTTLKNLASIAPLAALVTLDVSYNLLTDVATLGALPAMASLNLAFNYSVTSLHPLATSTFINAGDTINATGVGDCGTAFMTDLQAIKDKNVSLTDGCGI